MPDGELYSNSGPNNLGFVEPRVFLGSMTVNSDSNGNATFSSSPPHSFAGMATSEFFKGIKAP